MHGGIEVSDSNVPESSQPGPTGPEDKPDRVEQIVFIKAPKTPGTGALWLSILGFCGVTAILGIVLGFVARKEAKDNEASAAKANAAILIGAAWIAIFVLGVIVGALNPDSAKTASSASGTASPTVTASAPASSPSAAASVDPCVEWEQKAQDTARTEQQSAVDAVVEGAKAQGCDFPTPTGQPKPKKQPGDGWPMENGIAWQWVKKDQCDYGRCAQMNVIAKDNECPSGLYVSVNVLDGGGTIIGYSNDLLPSLRMGQKARLTFQIIEDGAKSIELNELKCY